MATRFPEQDGAEHRTCRHGVQRSTISHRRTGLIGATRVRLRFRLPSSTGYARPTVERGMSHRGSECRSYVSHLGVRASYSGNDRQAAWLAGHAECRVSMTARAIRAPLASIDRPRHIEAVETPPRPAQARLATGASIARSNESTGTDAAFAGITSRLQECLAASTPSTLSCGVPSTRFRFLTGDHRRALQQFVVHLPRVPILPASAV